MAQSVTSQGVLASTAIQGGGGGSGVTVYATLAALPLTGVTAGAQAYVTATNRLYLWTGTGWYNIALVNQAPTITAGANATYNLAADGTPTVVTLQGTDPEGLALVWSYEITSGSLGSIATITQNNNVFTITPSTNSANAGTFGITFKASDGINIATSASTITLAFITTRYANYGNTSSAANSGTGVGINVISNFPTSKSLYSGAYPFYFTSAAVPTLQTSLNGAVTLEFWCYLENTTYWTNFGTISASSDPSAYKRGMWISSTTNFITKNGDGYDNASTASVIGNWFHIAMCCGPTSCKYYKNGTLLGTAAALPAGNIIVFLPTHPGYYQDIEVHGEVKYTEAFTPTARKLA